MGNVLVKASFAIHSAVSGLMELFMPSQKGDSKATQLDGGEKKGHGEGTSGEGEKKKEGEGEKKEKEKEEEVKSEVKSTIPPPPPPPPVDPRVLIEEGRKELGIGPQEFHMAVVGRPGVGKTSFVHSVCYDQEPPEDDVDDRTRPMKHQHHILSRIYFWDIPALGTKISPNDFFMENKLYAFDCIFILSSDVFLEEEFTLAKLASNFQKPCAFVRTQSDVAFKHLVEELNFGDSLESVTISLREKAQANLHEGLQKNEIPINAQTSTIFLVSGIHTTTHNPYAITDVDGNITNENLKNLDEDKIYRYLLDFTKMRRVKTLSRTRSTAKPKQVTFKPDEQTS